MLSKQCNRKSALLLGTVLLLLLLAYSCVSTELITSTKMFIQTRQHNKLEIHTIEPDQFWEDAGYNTTIASAYFDLHSQSRHPSADYALWMSNFFKEVQAPMVVFTDHETMPSLLRMRHGKPTKVYVYSSLWNISRVGVHRDAYITSQHSMNPEKHIHIPEMYMIWNSKWEMLSITAKLNYYDTPYFMWVDAGSFRQADHNLRKWPDPNKMHSLFESYPNRVLLGLLAHPSQEILDQYSEEDGPYSATPIIQAGFFGGTAKLVHWYVDIFYETHDNDMQKGFFVGKEQNIMNQIAFTHEHMFVLLDTITASCGDAWFFFQQALANEAEAMKGCPDPVFLTWR